MVVIIAVVMHTKVEEDDENYYYSLFEDLPAASSFANKDAPEEHSWNSAEEILFSGELRYCCVCFVDMVNSTKIISQLTADQASKYYSIFLNSIATIAKNFNASIIKNAGDCLMYYFPVNPDSINPQIFKDVLDCGITIISARDIINSRLHEKKLPAINYRISADYGKVEFAKSSSLKNSDLFGSTVNLCAKINSKSVPNEMVIGKNLYDIVKSFEEYSFKEIGKYEILSIENSYPIYSIYVRGTYTILNPFMRTCNGVNNIQS